MLSRGHGAESEESRGDGRRIIGTERAAGREGTEEEKEEDEERCEEQGEHRCTRRENEEKENSSIWDACYILILRDSWITVAAVAGLLLSGVVLCSEHVYGTMVAGPLLIG